MQYIETLHQNQHMQGFTSDGKHMYWSFTDTLVKTTLAGTVRRCVPITGGHLGDIDYFDGKIYGSYLGNCLPGKEWNDWSCFKIYVFDAETLETVNIINLDICDEYKRQSYLPEDIRGFQGVDGVAIGKIPHTNERRMFVACAINDGEKYCNNIILQLTLDGVYETEYHIPTGNTVFGIQNLDYDESTGEFWFSTYNQSLPFQAKETLYKTDIDLTCATEKYEYSTPYGFECLGNGKYFASLQWGVNTNRGGCAYECEKEMFKVKKTEKEINEYIKAKLEEK